MASRNEEIVRQWLDQGFSQGQSAVTDALIADDFVNHTGLTGNTSGREGLKKAIVNLRAAFSGLKVRVDDVVSEGDLVAVRDEISAMHTGTFNGVPATGRPISVARISFFKLENGKVKAHWSQLDMAGLMRQLTSPTA